VIAHYFACIACVVLDTSRLSETALTMQAISVTVNPLALPQGELLQDAQRAKRSPIDVARFEESAIRSHEKKGISVCVLSHRRLTFPVVYLRLRTKED
jgi:hypothetical protein